MAGNEPHVPPEPISPQERFYFGVGLALSIFMMGFFILASWPPSSRFDELLELRENGAKIACGNSIKKKLAELDTKCSSRADAKVPIAEKPTAAQIMVTACALPRGIAGVEEIRTKCDDIRTLERDSAATILRLVFFCGILGALIHAATSFATYVGNGSFDRAWIWWYLLRPFIGGATAFVIVTLVAAFGGTAVLSVTAGKEDNLNGTLAIALMAGLFSKQAIDKTAEVFSTLFRSKVDEDRIKKYNPTTGKPDDDATGDDAVKFSPKELNAGEAGGALVMTSASFPKDVSVFIDGEKRDLTQHDDVKTIAIALTEKDMAPDKDPAKLNVRLEGAPDYHRTYSLPLVARKPEVTGIFTSNGEELKELKAGTDIEIFVKVKNLNKTDKAYEIRAQLGGSPIAPTAIKRTEDGAISQFTVNLTKPELVSGRKLSISVANTKPKYQVSGDKILEIN